MGIRGAGSEIRTGGCPRLADCNTDAGRGL